MEVSNFGPKFIPKIRGFKISVIFNDLVFYLSTFPLSGGTWTLNLQPGQARQDCERKIVSCFIPIFPFPETLMQKLLLPLHIPPSPPPPPVSLPPAAQEIQTFFLLGRKKGLLSG